MCVARWRVAKQRDAYVAVNTSRDDLSKKWSAACGDCEPRVCKTLNPLVGSACGLNACVLKLATVHFTASKRLRQSLVATRQLTTYEACI